MTLLQEPRLFSDAILGSVGRPLSVGFLSPHNPFDRTAFSGTAFYLHRALSQSPDMTVRVLGPHREPRQVDRLLKRLRTPRSISASDIETRGLDVVIGLVATSLLDGYRGTVPFIHITDATPSFLREAYGWDVPAAADAAERRVVAGSSLTVYSSRYMVRRAQTEFGAAAVGRVASIPFGINFDTLPDAAAAKPPMSPLRLLWVGRDWQRKGGAIAVAALDALRARGIPARLTMVGSTPAELRGHPGIDCVGYLDKNRPREAALLAHLFAQAHLFVLPTRADCTPMVVAEANAFGTPVLITDVGGVASLMEAGRNGMMLPPEATPAHWADAIRRLTADVDVHAALSRSSRLHAQTRLTWEAFVQDLSGLVVRSQPQAA